MDGKRVSTADVIELYLKAPAHATFDVRIAVVRLEN
jgi:hypothetical protein